MPGTGLVEVKIGVVADFNRIHNQKIAEGIMASVNAAVAAKAIELARHGLRITVLHKSDHGSQKFAREAVEALKKEGCLAIIGPCDSVLMAAVLAEAELADVPKISTLATATRLAELGRERGFFRFTPNDAIRAEHLIHKAGEVLGRNVLVYQLAATENAYATELAADMHEALRKHGRPYLSVPFQNACAIEEPPSDASAAIVCAPSVQALYVIGQLHKFSFSAPIFAFGSNSTFRDRAAVGTIVVADLDRADRDPGVKAILAGIDSRLSEPSLTTIDAVHVLFGILLSRPADDWSETQAGRELLMQELSGRLGIQGLFGPVWMDELHDREGSAGLYLLQVAEVDGGIDFVPWSPAVWGDAGTRQRGSGRNRVIFTACVILAPLLLAFALQPHADGINRVLLWAALVTIAMAIWAFPRR